MQRTFSFQAGGVELKFRWYFWLHKALKHKTAPAGWDALETKSYKAEGKRSNGNKGDETEEGAKVNGAAYRWKADHKEGATAWEMEMILGMDEKQERDRWWTERERREMKDKASVWGQAIRRLMEPWCGGRDRGLQGKCRIRQERSSILMGRDQKDKANTKMNQKVGFFTDRPNKDAF